MRASQFIVEYNQAKTAQVFGNKLIVALANDRSSHFSNGLGTGREYLRQKDKIGAPVEEASKQQIIKDILTAIENADPTPSKEYAQWLAKCYANEAQKLEDITSKGTDWLQKYHQFKVKKLLPENLRNIANIKFAQLYDIISNEALNAKLDAIENAPSKNRGQSETVLDNAEVRIIVPHDETAACYYGQGTQWCTAAKNNNMFNRYNQQGPMYIFLPKNPEYDGEKYQVHFSSGQYMDETDNPIPVLRLINGRFGNLHDFFIEREPDMKTWILFADDSVLESAVSKVREACSDFVNDILHEWMHHDEYYYTWLEEEGYVDEYGDIDWDRVPPYEDYNDEYRQYVNKIDDALSAPAGAIRQIAIDVSEDDDELYQISDIDKVISKHIEYEFRTRRGQSEDGGVAKFIRDKIWIEYNPKTKEVTAGVVR